MRFQFHKAPKVVIKTFTYQMPHLPLATFLHEVARSKFSFSELSLYVVHSIFFFFMMTVVNEIQ